METDEEEVVRKSRGIKDRGRRRVLRILGLIAIICMGIGVAAGVSSYLTVRTSAKDGNSLAQQVNTACEDPNVSADLAQFCPKAQQVVDSAPATVKGDPGPKGDTGNAGATGPPPSNAQVLVAVQRFCSDTGECKGNDGRNATPAQVASAVARYCDNKGQCRGPTGAAGQNGQDGSDGQDADPVTSSQVLAAVNTYCGQNNGCRGPAGADGQNGSDGQDGTDGSQGPAGVVNVVDNCAPAPDGQFIDDVASNYDQDTQTITISCTYRAQSLLP